MKANVVSAVRDLFDASEDWPQALKHNPGGAANRNSGAEGTNVCVQELCVRTATNDQCNYQ